MGAIEILTGLSVLLLIGILLTSLAHRLKFSNVILLIAAGFLVSRINYGGTPLFDFSQEFLTTIAIIALIMIVFDSTSRLPLRSISKDSTRALEISVLFLITELIILSVTTKLIFETSWFFSILFASIMVGTDPSVVLTVLESLKHPAITFLKIESVINTPITVILPFVVIEFSKTFHIETLIPQFIEQLAPFLQQIVTGVGAGLVVALIVFRVMRKRYSEVMSPLILVSSALLTYILAERLGGSGVLAVTTFGVFFGNFYIKRKRTLRTFGSLLSNLFEILVFLLLGISLTLPTDYSFYFKGFALFAIYLLIRAIIIFPSLRKDYNTKELTFIALNSPKGVAVGVVVFTLLSLNIETGIVIDLSLLFIIYSIAVATIMTYYSKYFLGAKAV